MTPYILASWLDEYASNSYCEEFEQAAITIRQQQAEIEALNKQVSILKTELINKDMGYK